MTAHENVTTAKAENAHQMGMIKRFSYWIAEVYAVDHAMKIAVVFFAIALVVLTKLFGPGA